MSNRFTHFIEYTNKRLRYIASTLCSHIHTHTLHPHPLSPSPSPAPDRGKKKTHKCYTLRIRFAIRSGYCFFFCFSGMRALTIQTQHTHKKKHLTLFVSSTRPFVRLGRGSKIKTKIIMETKVHAVDIRVFIYGHLDSMPLVLFGPPTRPLD